MTYPVVVTREGNNWLAEVPGLPGAHSWAKGLAALDFNIRETIALVEDLPEGAESGLDLVWDFTALDDPLLVEAAELARARRQTEQMRCDIAARSKVVAGALSSRDWPVRDIAEALGVSPGRVSQLLAA